MTDLEAILIATVIWMYVFGLVQSVFIAVSENYKFNSKTIIGCLLWPFVVPYACITINKDNRNNKR